MFSMSSTSKQETKPEIIRVAKDWQFRLGFMTALDGVEYHIEGYFNRDGDREKVWACPKSKMHSYYYDTSTINFGDVSQTWKTYYIERVNNSRS